jgi:uncharacterized protein YdeI (YjbR/CyaY-like superfamily)
MPVRKTKAKAKAQKKTKKTTEPKPIRAFRTQQDFEARLEKNQDKTEGVWIRFAKKGSGIKSVSHQEALDSALCYGWIDALVHPES